MRRNIELIRMLVLAVEDTPPEILAVGVEIDGFTPEEIGYHSYLLVDAGLAEGVDIGTVDGSLPEWSLSHLTWSGHDFADAARDDSRWAKATTVVKEKAGTVTFDVLKQVLSSLIKNALGV
jgi:hypothetical protein